MTFDDVVTSEPKTKGGRKKKLIKSKPVIESDSEDAASEVCVFIRYDVRRVLTVNNSDYRGKDLDTYESDFIDDSELPVKTKTGKRNSRVKPVTRKNAKFSKSSKLIDDEAMEEEEEEEEGDENVDEIEEAEEDNAIELFGADHSQEVKGVEEAEAEVEAEAEADEDGNEEQDEQEQEEEEEGEQVYLIDILWFRCLLKLP